MNKLERGIITSAATGAIIGLLFWLGTMDYEDAMAEEDHYCDMVNEGAWPNYREVDCGNNKETGKAD